jgi:hypothetical protein
MTRPSSKVLDDLRAQPFLTISALVHKSIGQKYPNRSYANNDDDAIIKKHEPETLLILKTARASKRKTENFRLTYVHYTKVSPYRKSSAGDDRARLVPVAAACESVVTCQPRRQQGEWLTRICQSRSFSAVRVIGLHPSSLR